MWIDYFVISNSLIDSLLGLICMSLLSIWIIVVSMFMAVFTRINCIMFVNWLLSYIYLWFIVSLLALIYMLFLSICIIVVRMFVNVFYEKFFFISWRYWYLTSSSLINSLLALICMLILVIWIIVAGMSMAVWNEISVWLWNDFYLISSLLIDFYVLRSEWCFFLFELL